MEGIAEALAAAVAAVGEVLGTLFVLLAEWLIIAILWTVRPIWKVDAQELSLTEARRKSLKRVVVVCLGVTVVGWVVFGWFSKPEPQSALQHLLPPALKERAKELEEMVEKKIREKMKSNS